MRQGKKKHKVKLSRVLTRDCSFRGISEDDLKYVWASYKKGALPVDIFPSGLDVEGFNEVFYDVLASVPFVYILEKDKTPMGIVLSVLTPPRKMEPHVEWFPWATRRNKLECAIKFLNEMRKRDILLLIWSKKEATPFFTHIAKYGILHRVGKVINYNGKKEDAMLFQGR